MSGTERTRPTAVAAGQVAAPQDLPGFLAEHHAALVVLSGPRQGSELPLHRPRVEIGRASSCDLVFDHPTVSRTHAAIVFRSGRFVVEDLDSTNGVVVDGQRIAARDLAHGTRITLGMVELQVVVEVRAPAPKEFTLDVE